MLQRIDYSKPFDVWADKQNHSLFDWVKNTWYGYVEKILQVLENDDISNDQFVTVISKLALTFDEGEAGFKKLTEAANGHIQFDRVLCWSRGNRLPSQSKREPLVRFLLAIVTKKIRAMAYPEYVYGALRLIGDFKDYRDGSYRLVTPASHLRSIYRLGFKPVVADILDAANIKTLGDLRHFVELPLHERRRNPCRLSADRLRKLPGMDEANVRAVLETVSLWDEHMHMTPSTVGL